MEKLVFKHYVALAMTLMAIGIIMAITFILWERTTAYAVEVNMAGKQRMVSHRIAMMTLRLGDPRFIANEEYKNELLRCLETLTVTNDALRSHNDQRLHDIAETAFPCLNKEAYEQSLARKDHTTGLQQDVELSALRRLIDLYVNEVTRLVTTDRLDNSERDKVLDIGINELPRKIDVFVAKIQKEAETNLFYLRITQVALLAILAACSIALLLIYIRPVLRSSSQAEDKLSVLGAAIERSHLGMVVCRIGEKDNPVEFVNPAFCLMTGYKPEDITGRDLRFLQGKKTEQGELDRLRNAIKTKRDITLVLANYTANGELFWNELTVTPFKGRGSKGFTHFIGVQRDVTKRIKTEEMLAETLEQANAAAEVKASFLASMSHELRTPLNAILGFSEIISSMHLTANNEAKVKEYVNDIHASGRHLHSLVNDLLDISALEAGHRKIEIIPIDLVSGLTESVKSLQSLYEKKEINIEVNAPVDFPQFYTDPRSLHQIVLNLVSNSIKYSEPNTLISMDCVSHEAGISIAFRDEGHGISPARLPSIFEPFSKETADPHVVDNTEGTGLGLSIVRNLVEQLHGNIDITSQLGLGTTVTISFSNSSLNKAAPE